MQITPKYNVTLRCSGVLKKGFKHWILNRFLLVNSEMWIRTAIKLPHDLGVCQKTVGNSAEDFHGGGERKTPTSWIRTALKSPTTPCIWWKSLTSPWETITVRIGLKICKMTRWKEEKNISMQSVRGALNKHVKLLCWTPLLTRKNINGLNMLKLSRIDLWSMFME